ncbi:MAG: IPT/TIG domain-containing protein, partial [Desulfobacterales bacterium]|nr:IPT/TIG domain-containing protein [Desulfobacterales bacterium]
GATVPFDLSINNNDAKICLEDHHSLSPGDRMTLVVREGVSSVDSVEEDDPVVLYRLERDLRYALTYIGEKAGAFSIDSVMPRRAPSGKEITLKVAGKGLPSDKKKIALWVGGVKAEITELSVEQNAIASGIVTATLPAISHPGLYDVTLIRFLNGSSQAVRYLGGLAIDAPIQFHTIVPMWGPPTGGTRLTLTGKGFQPGNTMMDGLSLRIGDVPVVSVQVISSTTLYATTRGGRPGRHQVVGEDRYGNETRLTEKQGFGYGLNTLSTETLSTVHPSSIVVDHESGVGITNGGLLVSGYSLQELGLGLYGKDQIIETYRAASFDLQNPADLLFVGGVSSLPSGAEKEALFSDIGTGLFNYPVGIDSVRFAMADVHEDETTRRCLYVASGTGGIAALNLDDENGLQLISQVMEESESRMVADVAASGNLVFAATANAGEICEIKSKCGHCLAGSNGDGRIEVVSYAHGEDPVRIGPLTAADGTVLEGSGRVKQHGAWLYAAGSQESTYWDACYYGREYSLAHPKPSNNPSRISSLNVADKGLMRHYDFDARVLDFEIYDTWLIAALGKSNVVFVNLHDPEERFSFELNEALQINEPEVFGLKIFGNLLFASSKGGGLIVLDLTNPWSPEIISAGNTFSAESVDYFKGHLVAVGSQGGLASLELPGSFVSELNVEEGGVLPSASSLVVTFNEYMDIASFSEDGAVSLINEDSGKDVAILGIEPVDPENGSARTLAIGFERKAGARYRLSIRKASNLRSGGLWRPFIRRFIAGQAGTSPLALDRVKGGIAHSGHFGDVTVYGKGFLQDGGFHLFINATKVPHEEITVVNDAIFTLSAAAVNGADLSPGVHTFRVQNSASSAVFAGALVAGDGSGKARFTLSSTSGDIAGGQEVVVAASRQVILPGSKVVLRSFDGEEIRTLVNEQGEILANLYDDVLDLSTIRFRMPKVLAPKLFNIFVESGTQLLSVGTYSYTVEGGRGIDLPNYPPMKIGAATSKAGRLFVGVKEGRNPTHHNRFLMKSGLEIYDISIWDRPVRLSQVRLSQPVTGVAVGENLAFLASGHSGLVVVGIHDLEAPHVLGTYPVAQNMATDVALDHASGILALSVAEGSKGGYIRFFDSRDPELDQPAGLQTLVLTGDQLGGMPLDITWHNGMLYTLLKKEGTLRMAIFDPDAGPNGVSVHHLGVSASSDVWHNYGFVVQYGQVVVTNGEEMAIVRQNEAGAYEKAYWQACSDFQGDGNPGFELYNQQGSVFVSNGQGVTDTPAPIMAVTSVMPGFGSTLSTGKPVIIRLNRLIHTGTPAGGTPSEPKGDDEESAGDEDDDPYDPADAITLTLTDGKGNTSELKRDAWTLVATNTLSGGELEIVIVDDTLVNGKLDLLVSKSLRGLASSDTLNQDLSGCYVFSTASSPVITDVYRLSGSGLQSVYAHGDGTETIVVKGDGFFGGEGALLPMKVTVGAKELATENLTPLENLSGFTFTLPELHLSRHTCAIPLSVSIENGGEDLVTGALVIQPSSILQSISPVTGPPQGGNWVNLFGVGFNAQMRVSFGDTPAGNVRLRNSGHVEVRAPSGTFGYSDISVSSRFFPDEVSTLPLAYFYAGTQTGSVELSHNGHQMSPLRAMVAGDQILYTVTGGRYPLYDRQGRSLGMGQSSVGQLVLTDISDPVHPELILKKKGDTEKPYFKEINLPLPSVNASSLDVPGFADLAVDGQDLLVAGAKKLIHFDVTLAADPYEIQPITLTARANHLTFQDGICYLSQEDGLAIFVRQSDGRMKRLYHIAADELGGTPGDSLVWQDKLFVLLTDAGKMAMINLVSGHFEVVKTLTLADSFGRSLLPENLLKMGDLLIISGGSSASVTAFRETNPSAWEPVADLSLKHLNANSTLHAGELLGWGQTLAVSAGDGDLQLFDISPWLAGNFGHSVELLHYYAVTGAVTSSAANGGFLYAGTAYAYVGDTPSENPFDAAVGKVSGGINTLTDDGLSVVTQQPKPQGVLAQGEAVEIQLNRIVDQELFETFKDQWLRITRSGAEVPGIVSHRIANEGSRLIFRPQVDFAPETLYVAHLSNEVTGLHGRTLSGDYRFQFFAETAPRPVVHNVDPSFGSWRGGDEVTLYGDGFTTETKVCVGGVTLQDDQVISVTDKRMVVTLPGLSEAPERNLLVGVTVQSGRLIHVKPAAFTIVTEPVINEIGAWSEEQAAILTSTKRFGFNGGELIGISGRGFSEATRVSVNGKVIDGVSLKNGNLVFPVPDQTIGKLSIVISNQEDGADSVSDNRVCVDFISSVRLTSVASRMARDGDILALARGNKVRIYTTRDGLQPSLLSTVSTQGQIHELVISQGYLALVTGANHDLSFYSLSNFYAPAKVHGVTNPTAFHHKNLSLEDGRWFSMDGEILHAGSLYSPAWKDIEVSGLIDLKTDGETLALLTQDNVILRLASSPEEASLSAPISHSVDQPRSLHLHGERALVCGTSSLTVLPHATLSAGISAVHHKEVPGLLKAAICGELIAILTPEDSGTLTLFDWVNGESQTLSEVARVRNASSGIEFKYARAVSLTSNLLEWHNGSSYCNAEIPLPNLCRITSGSSIVSADQSLLFEIAGEPAPWEDVVLLAQVKGDGTQVSGSTTLVGDKLKFTPVGSGFVSGESYVISVAGGAVSPLITGGTISQDTPWHLKAVDLFGVSGVAVSRVAPSVVVAGETTPLTVYGASLHDVDRFSLGKTSVASEAITVSEEGTRASFDVTLNEAGILSLSAHHGQKTSTLMAALLVSDSLSISGLSVKGGGLAISDAGHTEVTVSGDGFNGNIALYFYPDLPGYKADASTQRAFSYRNGDLVFVTPPVLPGCSYVVEVIKAETGGSAVASQRLVGTDDTPPVCTSLTKMTQVHPLKLTFSESLGPVSFVATCSYLDYSGAADSSAEELFHLTARQNEVIVSLKEGAHLSANRRYTLTLSSLKDPAGNLAKGKGVVSGAYTTSLATADTLAPKNLGLVLGPGGTPITSDTVLHRGSSYGIKPVATDNVSPVNALRYTLRFSTDGGNLFGPAVSLSPHGFWPLEVKEADEALVLRLLVTDRAGKSRSVDIKPQLAEPEIHIEAVDHPDSVEELSTKTFAYKLSGHVSMVKSVSMVVGQKLYTNTKDANLHFDKQNGAVQFTWTAPRRVDSCRGEGDCSLPLTLQVHYGFDSIKAKTSQVIIAQDMTAPEVKIVSPESNTGVPRGVSTRVAVRVWDTYGIEKVTRSVGGEEAVVMDDTTGFDFTPTGEAPITLRVTAYDFSGNKATDSVAVTPVDPHGVIPSLDLLSPQTGITRHAKEPISAVACLRELTTAELRLEVAGEQNHPLNQTHTITRKSDGPEVVSLSVTLPDVQVDDGKDESLQALKLTLVSGTLKESVWINVKEDSGIGTELELYLSPLEEVLGGTTLYAAAAPKEPMDDFSDASLLFIEDPTGEVPIEIPLSDRPKALGVTNEGDSVKVCGVLKDRSGHQALAEASLTKHPYVGGALKALNGSGAADTLKSFAVVWPEQDEVSLLRFDNLAGGGARLVSGETVLWSGNLTRVKQAEFTGSGVVASVVLQDPAPNTTGRAFVYWPVTDGGLASPITTQTLGHLIGASGETLFVRHGQHLSALFKAGDRFEPLAGVSLPEEESLIQCSIANGRIYALTSSMLYCFEPLFSPIPSIKKVFGVAMEEAKMFAIDGTHLVILSHLDKASSFTMDPNTGALTGEVRLDAAGKISGMALDGELTWLRIAAESGERRWDAFKGASCVGHLETSAKDLVFCGNTLVASHADGTVETLSLAATSVSQDLSLSLTDRPLGVLIHGLSASETLGGEDFSLFDAGGRLIPHESVIFQQEKALFVAYGHLQHQEMTLVRYDRSGQHIESQLSVNLPESGVPLVSVTPTESKARGAVVPVVVTFDSGEKASRLALEDRFFVGREGLSASLWHALSNDPDLSAAALAIKADGVVMEPISLPLMDNDSSMGEVSILAPRPNDTFTEGETLTLHYLTKETESEALQAVSISLEDFNGVSIGEVKGQSHRGQLQLLLPQVTELQVLHLRVTAWFGEAWHAVTKMTEIKVFPKYKIPEPVIEGCSRRIMEGSLLTVWLSNPPDSQLTSDIQVFAVSGETESLVESDTFLIDVVVPACETLRIKGTLQDGLGNTKTIQKEIRVVSPFGVTLASESKPWLCALTGESAMVYGTGSGVVGEDGLLVKTEAPVTALARYQGAILAAHGEGISLVEEGAISASWDIEAHRLVVSGTLLLTSKDQTSSVSAHRLTGRAATFLRSIPLSGEVLQLHKSSQGAAILTESELVFVDQSGAVIRRYSGSFTAAAQTETGLWALDASGSLSRFAQGKRVSRREIDLYAHGLVGFDGFLFALLESSMVVVDIRNPFQPEVVGSFPMDMGWKKRRSVLQGGKLYLGGESGKVVQITPSAHVPRCIYDMAVPKGRMMDLSIARWGAVAAADQYGAYRLVENQKGEYTESIHPAPFSISAREVDTYKDSVFVLQPTARRVSRVGASGNTSVILSSKDFSHLAVFGDLLAVSFGEKILVTRASNPGRKTQVLSMGQGETIHALCAYGNKVLVSTPGGLSLLRLPSFPCEEDEVEVQAVSTGLTESVQTMASDGAWIYFAIGETLYRKNPFDSKISEAHPHDFGAHITTLSTHRGRLLVGSGHDLIVVKTEIWTEAGIGLTLDTGRSLFAATALGDLLATGFGEEGMSLYRLASSWSEPKAEIRTPVEGALCHRQSPLFASLVEESGIAQVSWCINGKSVMVMDTPPFSGHLALPASLANGNTFTLSARTLSYWGDVRESRPVTMRIQESQAAPETFMVSLTAHGNYLPAPVRLTASVSGNEHPIDKITLYHQPSGDTEWRLLTSARYVPLRYFFDATSSENDSLVKARGVDIYGNAFESVPVSLQRLVDEMPPSDPNLHLDGTLDANGRPIAGHPFKVHATIQDTGSGIKQAILMRGGVVMRVLGAAGLFVYQENNPTEGSTYDYTLLIEDMAGNTLEKSLSCHVSVDTEPQVVSITPLTFFEQDTFSPQISLKDDVGIERTEITWNGKTQTRQFLNHPKHKTLTLSIIDERSKLTPDVDKLQQKLTVVVYDTSGQSAQASETMTVLRDKPPESSYLTLSVPKRVFKGADVPLTIGMPGTCDDRDIHELKVDILDVTQETESLLVSRHGASLFKSFFKAYTDKEAMKVKVRLTDRLHQTAESSVVTIPLEHLPNEVIFVSDASPQINPKEAKVGDPVTLKGKIMDANGDPVAGLTLSWTLVSGPGSSGHYLGASRVNSEGIAAINFGTSKTSGHYTIKMFIKEFPTLASSHALELVPGVPSQILISHIKPVRVAEDRVVRLRALD